MANRFFPNYDTYIITSPFGMRTLNGSTRFHNGIDLVAKSSKGTGATDYITAHTGGTVSGVGFDKSAGYFVNIRVSANTTFHYFHLREQSKLKKGDVVKQGQIIGYMGSTGNSTGAHLHWGIKYNGSWINPTPYLDKDYTEPNTKPEGTTAKVNVELDILRQGAKGEQVKALQRMLYAMGYNLGESKVDGSFGPMTDAVVKAYQKKKGLAVDGIVGPATWNKLLKG